MVFGTTVRTLAWTVRAPSGRTRAASKACRRRRVATCAPSWLAVCTMPVAVGSSVASIAGRSSVAATRCVRCRTAAWENCTRAGRSACMACPRSASNVRVKIEPSRLRATASATSASMSTRARVRAGERVKCRPRAVTTTGSDSGPRRAAATRARAAAACRRPTGTPAMRTPGAIRSRRAWSYSATAAAAPPPASSTMTRSGIAMALRIAAHGGGRARSVHAVHAPDRRAEPANRAAHASDRQPERVGDAADVRDRGAVLLVAGRCSTSNGVSGSSRSISVRNTRKSRSPAGPHSRHVHGQLVARARCPSRGRCGCAGRAGRSSRA